MDDAMILPCGHSFGSGGVQHVIRMVCPLEAVCYQLLLMHLNCLLALSFEYFDIQCLPNQQILFQDV